MEKAYNPVAFESRLYQWWNEKGFFKANDTDSRPPFVIMIPPPNVTGALHNGHALFLTLQDILIRWKRMSGFNALWLPGTDHAGIATQMVVERELAKEGNSRHKLGRDKFIKRVWEWKEKHGGIITNQIKVMGASVDWTRERFTMDDGLSRAVREVFVTLYEQGLIYRGSYINSWCHKCHTVLSDLEVTPKERKGHLWHLRYPIAGVADTVVIATTRPETMLGDTAIAVNPNDDRYKHIVGKKVKLPITGREIPVVADEHVDMTFGTGALKVTPGHDFHDYEIGKRHKLPVVNVFNKDGTVNELGGKFQGLKILDAREKVVAELQETGVLVKTEDHNSTVGVCQRCETIVEPMVSEQWFVRAKTLAEPALAAVKKGERLPLSEVDKHDDAVKIVPESWNATYYHFMENIKDWCISRQLWWGHQIPAWYCGSCGETIVSRQDVTACPKCKASGDKLRRDEDVLDTWFSSGLWPFSTLGWPDKTQALKTFYPGHVLETGHDILFFWVARMIMMGMHFMDGKVPFHRVYLHSLVRDEKGQKMSKTKGNVIDPLDVVKEHGADAFRFTLTSMAGHNRDIRLSIDRVALDRAFCNKLWNASRYALMRMGIVPPPINEETGEPVSGFAPQGGKIDFAAITGGKTLGEYIAANRTGFHPLNRWILSQLQHSIGQVERGFEEFRMNDAAQALYHFTWDHFCDWYIEYSKVLLAGADKGQAPHANETYVTVAYVLEELLKLAHPVIPFVTEEIYQHLPARPGVKAGSALMVAQFPKVNDKWIDTAADKSVAVWSEAIAQIRKFRGENNISPKARPVVTFDALAGHDDFLKTLSEGAAYVKAVAQLESFEREKGDLKNDLATGEMVLSGAKLYIPLRGLVDFGGEKKRLEKEKSTVEADIAFVTKKLSNESFVARAPQELVDAEKTKLKGLEVKLAEVVKSLERISKIQS